MDPEGIKKLQDNSIGTGFFCTDTSGCFSDNTIVIEESNKNIDFGLKSKNISLSITPDLSPGLFNDLEDWALALN